MSSNQLVVLFLSALFLSVYGVKSLSSQEEPKYSAFILQYTDGVQSQTKVFCLPERAQLSLHNGNLVYRNYPSKVVNLVVPNIRGFIIKNQYINHGECN